MSQDVVTMMMKLIRESIEQMQTSVGVEPDRALTRVLAHLWSAHDELDLCRRPGHARAVGA
jgi:hypothetical protein